MQITYYEKMLKSLGHIINDSFFKELDKRINNKILPLPEFQETLFEAYPTLKMAFNDIAVRQNNIEGYFTSINILFSSYYFWKNNTPVYKISDNLLNSLIVTTLEKMNTNFIKLPKKIVYLSFSNNFFTIHHPETGYHQVYGAYIIENEDEEYRYWRVLLVGEENNNKRLEYGGLDDCLFFYRIKFPKNKIIEKNFNDIISMEGDVKFNNDIYKKQVDESINILANIILYINTDKIPNKLVKNDIPECNTKKIKKIKRWEAEHANRSRLKYYSLGEHLGNIFDSEKDVNCKTIKERMIYTYRWIVKGHFHTYWVGEGRTDIELKWICPYWKGWK